MKTIILILLGILTQFQLQAQYGCTDPNASNYNATATYNNGSCTYAATSYSLTHIANLSATLTEISGMIYYNGKIYGHVDSGGPTAIYEINPTTGAITKTITLQGITNVDWEDMTQDATHIYVGDVGNNSSGNRANLKIYKFPKSAITAGASITIPSGSIETINFSYEDQTDFTPTIGGNNTKYDCEAIAFNRGKLHLFTKNWIGNYTMHYVIPTTAGTHSAIKIDSINTGIYRTTGADFGADDLLILIAYTNQGISSNAALFLDFGFDGTYYYLNSGAKRRLDLGSVIGPGQVEGICFVNAMHGYASNEKLPAGFFTVTQSIRSFNIRNYIKNYYQHNQKTYDLTEPAIQAGTIRFHHTAKRVEGFDGTHWKPFKF